MPPPVFSTPMFHFVETTGYSSFYERSQVLIDHPVRVEPEQTSALDGLELIIRDLSPDSSWRNVYALTKGQVLFSYIGGDSTYSVLRAMLKIILPDTTRSLPNNSSRLKRFHPDDSLAAINENFSTLQFIQYQNLDLEATKLAISNLVDEAQRTPDAPGHSWILNTLLPVQIPGRRGTRTGTSTLLRFLSSHTIDEYLDDVLFNAERLTQLSSQGWSEDERPAWFPINVNAGDIIGVAAQLIQGDSSVMNAWKIFLKFHANLRGSSAGYTVLNPAFFLNAVVKHSEGITFVGEEEAPDNKLGLQALYELSNVASLPSPPPAAARVINPLMWALSKGNYGVFRVTPSGEIVPESFPNLYVFGPEDPVYHPSLREHLIDVQERQMNVFHPHIRYPIRHGARTGERLSAGIYQWKINDRGYLVFRTNTDGSEDDWFPKVSQDDFNRVKRIWEQNGEHINRLSLIYGLPCETFVGVAGKESGGSTAAVGIEPWIPPPNPAANMPPFTNRSLLKATPPEEIIVNYSHVPGIKYMIITNRWNSSSHRWESSRTSAAFPGESHLDDPIPRTGIPPVLQPLLPYTWRELLTDLDHFGHTSGQQPAIAQGDKRFLRSMDGRISPGLTQVLVREVPFSQGVSTDIQQRIQSEFGADFFVQPVNPIYPSRPPGNVLSRDTPPSYRFLWLRDAAHTLLSSFNLISNRVHALYPEYCTSRAGGVCQSGFALGEHNDYIDPLFAVTVYGGMGDIQDFIPTGSAFGFLADTDSVNNRRLHHFPPKFNACVLLFDSFRLFGPGRLVPPAVRLMRGFE